MTGWSTGMTAVLIASLSVMGGVGCGGLELPPDPEDTSSQTSAASSGQSSSSSSGQGGAGGEGGAASSASSTSSTSSSSSASSSSSSSSGQGGAGGAASSSSSSSAGQGGAGGAASSSSSGQGGAGGAASSSSAGQGGAGGAASSSSSGQGGAGGAGQGGGGGSPEACNNGVDDDKDERVDCDDSDCAADPICNSAGETVCSNLVDEDGDGLVDCEDPTDCKNLAVCQPGTGPVGSPCLSPNQCAANNGDPFCLTEHDLGWPDGYCSEFCDPAAADCPAGTLCGPGASPSGAGLCVQICAVNSDCRLGYSCQVIFPGPTVCWPAAEDCENGIDDDGDGLIDCLDPNCAQAPNCIIPEVCGNGIDDDNDLALDCEDSDCAADPSCPNASLCAAPITLLDGVTFNGTTVGGSASFAGSCTGGLGAFENVFAFTPGSAGQTGNVTVVLSSATDQGFYVRSLCNDPLSQLTCVDQAFGGTDEVATFPVNGGDPLAIFVDGFLDPAEAGPFTLTATFTPVVPEVCTNGIDDDNDFTIDCEDSDCAADPSCPNASLCAAPITLLDGVPASGTTVGGSASFAGSCTGGLGAFENVFTFTPGSAGQTGTVTVVLSSGTDQGFYVRSLCSDPLTELTCTDANFGGTDEIATFPVNGGDPLAIFVDGFLDPAEAGPFTLTATFTPTAPETCGNGIDDDNDLAIDCEDSDCTADPSCPNASLCAAPITLLDGVPASGTTVGGSASFSGTCTGGLGAFENVFTFTPGSAGQTGTVTVLLSSATDQGFYVRPLCNDPLTELACTDAKLGGEDEIATFNVNGGDPLSIFVDGFFNPAEAGPFTLTATFTSAVSPGPAPQLAPRAHRAGPWASFLHAR